MSIHTVNFTAHVQSVVFCVFQGRSGLAGSQVGRSFPRRSFVRPSWMDEDTVDSADASVSLFFSKVSSRSVVLWPELPTSTSFFCSNLTVFSTMSLLDTHKNCSWFFTLCAPTTFSVQGDVHDEMYSMADDVFESPPLSASIAPSAQPDQKFPSL